MQKYARTKSVPIDSIKLDFEFLEDETKVPKLNVDGAFIRGMFLEGAKWNNIKSVLNDADPMQLHYKMPIVHIKTVEKIQKASAKIGFYESPVYICPDRSGTINMSSYLFSINLPFENKEYQESFWIKRGTAVLLSLNY